MTEEELDAEKLEGKELMSQIQALLNGKEESVVMNTLLCVLINACKDLEVPPAQILVALANGFDMLTAHVVDFGTELEKEKLN